MEGCICWQWCGREEEKEKGGRREAVRTKKEMKKKWSPEVLLIELKYFLFRTKTGMCCGRTGAMRCWSANRKFFKLSCYLLFIYYSSKSSDSGPHLTPSLCVWPCESERVWKSFVFLHFLCTQFKVISLSLTDKNQLRKLTRDARLHETILGRDMNYHTEGNLKKMNSWITNISCLFFFLHFCFPWCFKHESWGKWATLQPEKKSKNDNQIAAAMTVWLGWYSALITENAEFIIYTFHSFLCSYGLRNIELWELCN